MALGEVRLAADRDAACKERVSTYSTLSQCQQRRTLLSGLHAHGPLALERGAPSRVRGVVLAPGDDGARVRARAVLALVLVLPHARVLRHVRAVVGRRLRRAARPREDVGRLVRVVRRRGLRREGVGCAGVRRGHGVWYVGVVCGVRL